MAIGLYYQQVYHKYIEIIIIIIKILLRIKKNDHLKEIQDYLSTVFELLKLIPTPNIPYYFTKIIFDIINIVEIKTLTNIKTPKIKLQTRFLQKLVLSTYQFIGFSSFFS